MPVTAKVFQSAVAHELISNVRTFSFTKVVSVFQSAVAHELISNHEWAALSVKPW